MSGEMMTPQGWQQLQLELHPMDLVSVQRFAEALHRSEPFVFAHDVGKAGSLEGPGARNLARDVLAVLYGLRSEGVPL